MPGPLNQIISSSLSVPSSIVCIFFNLKSAQATWFSYNYLETIALFHKTSIFRSTRINDDISVLITFGK